MSSQTIYHNTVESINEKVDKLFIKFGKDYQMYSRFRVGSKPNIKYICVMGCLGRILCEDNCYLDIPKCDILEVINLKAMRNVL